MFSGIQATRRRNDGTNIDVEISAAPVRDTEGEVVGLMALYMDVTERSRHEAAVRAERDFLVTLSRATPSLIAVLNADGRVDADLGVNKAFWDIMGFTDNLAMGRFASDLVAAPGEKEAFFARLCSRRSRLHRRSSVRAPGSRSTDRRHRPQGARARAAAGARRDRHARPDDPDVDRRGRPGRAHPHAGRRAGINRAFKETFGWSEVDLGGRSLIELIHPDDVYAALMAIGSAANGVPAVERESRWRCPNGEFVVVEWTATPMPDPSSLDRTLVLVSGTDVTNRVRQEEEIRASRSRIVQAADEMRRKLERNLHDGAQQRLVALSVSLRLAETKLASDPVAAAVILGAARDELAHALEELRELARGIHPAVLTDRGLAAAIEALVTRTPLPVDVELPEDRLPPAVEAALYYVVSESLTNVVKYAGATSAQVRLELNGEGTVTAEVIDDGVGGADPDHGSGLRGLVDRVEALDGSLVVESPREGGTRVRVEVPLPVVVE